MAENKAEKVKFLGGWLVLIKEGDVYQTPNGEKKYDYSGVKFMFDGLKYPTTVPKEAIDALLRAFENNPKFKEIYKSLGDSEFQ